MHILLVGLNARYTHSCLALFYVRNELATYLEGSHAVQIRQCTINDSYYDLLLRLTAEEADFYFFSASIWNSDLVEKLIGDILRINRKSHCVVGGPQAEVVCGNCRHERLSGVVGAIEEVGRSFYTDLVSNNLHGIYAAATAGRPGNFSSPYIDSDFQEHLRYRHIYYETSRGCPHSCSYCLSAARKGIFHKDLEMVRGELQTILSWNPAVVRFVDRTFNSDLDRALAIWEFLAEQECQTVFHFEMSPDRFNERMFTFLSTLPPGKFQFEIGVQSAHPPTLEAIGRTVDLERSLANVRRLSRLGTIHLHVDLILGLPCETEESFLESFRTVFSMYPHYIQMGLLKMLPDTPLSGVSGQYGYVCSRSTPYPVLANQWLDHATLSKLYWFGECVERFVNNRYFSSLWRYLRRRNIDSVAFFRGLHEVCLHQDFHNKAPTQEFLVALLVEYLFDWDEGQTLVDLLRYDWLRCGHRYFPACLDVPDEFSSKRIRQRLFRLQNQSDIVADCGDEMFHYLKKGFFFRCSPGALRELGYVPGAGEHFLCGVPERGEGLYRYNKVALFALVNGDLSSAEADTISLKSQKRGD